MINKGIDLEAAFAHFQISAVKTSTRDGLGTLALATLALSWSIFDASNTYLFTSVGALWKGKGTNDSLAGKNVAATNAGITCLLILLMLDD